MSQAGVVSSGQTFKDENRVNTNSKSSMFVVHCTTGDKSSSGIQPGEKTSPRINGSEVEGGYSMKTLKSKSPKSKPSALGTKALSAPNSVVALPSTATVLPYTPPRFPAFKAATESVRSIFRRPSPNALGKRPVRSVEDLRSSEDDDYCDKAVAAEVEHANETNPSRPPTSTQSPRTRMGYMANSSSNNSGEGSSRDPSPSYHNSSRVDITGRRPSECNERQMSLCHSDEFTVKACNLTDEFVPPIRLPGVRGSKLAKGSSATVRIMYKKGSSRAVPYAVKEFRKRERGQTEEEHDRMVKTEFSIASSLHHPNIVETVRLCTYAGRWNHVMEYCSYGLFALVEQNYLSMDDKLCLFKQLLQGVAYLHKTGIAHRDIKVENLLVTTDSHLKISDFGVATVFRGPHPGMRYSSLGGLDEVRRCAPGICGSGPYIAPEVLAKNGEYDPRPLDIWSSAMTCITMFCRGTPWRIAEESDPSYAIFLSGWNRFLERSPNGLVTNVDYPSCGPLFKRLKPALSRLLLRMLHPDPIKRATVDEVLETPWLGMVDCCCPIGFDPSKFNLGIGAKGTRSCRSTIRNPPVHNHLPPRCNRFRL